MWSYKITHLQFLMIRCLNMQKYNLLRVAKLMSFKSKIHAVLDRQLHLINKVDI